MANVGEVKAGVYSAGPDYEQAAIAANTAHDRTIGASTRIAKIAMELEGAQAGVMESRYAMQRAAGRIAMVTQGSHRQEEVAAVLAEHENVATRLEEVAGAYSELITALREFDSRIMQAGAVIETALPLIGHAKESAEHMAEEW